MLGWLKGKKAAEDKAAEDKVEEVHEEMVLDTQEALPRFANKQELYLQILDKVVADYGDVADQLREMVKNGQFEDARFLTHTVKGVFGNIGARELFGLCLRLEQALAEEPSGDSPSRLVEDVAGAVQRLLGCIASGVSF